MAPSANPTFPPLLGLELSDFERALFDWLKERLPGRSDEELGRGVVARGLAVVIEEERRKAEGLVSGGAPTVRRIASPSRAHKLFPSHFTLVLGERDRLDLEEVYDLDPDLRDEVEMMHKAIRAGIQALKQVARKRDPTKLTRTEMEASKTSMTQTAARKRRLECVAPAPRSRTDAGSRVGSSSGAAQRRRLRRAAMFRAICSHLR